MSTQCSFDFPGTKDVEMRFDEGPITTDAGLSVFIEWMNCESFLDPYAEILEASDDRDPNQTDHSRKQLLGQRVLQMVAGYEDANDSDELSEDWMFKAANGRMDEDADNASQPTMTRFENAPDGMDVTKLNQTLLEDYIESRRTVPQRITIEIDGTPASTHGDQQRALFDGYRGQNQYHPLMIADSDTERIAIRASAGGNGPR